MIRLTALLLALTAAAPVSAAYYQASPVTAPAKAKLFTQHGLWTCDDAGCSAAKSNSRPAIVCQALVQKIGPVREFRAADAALSPQQLEKCNRTVN